MKDVYDVHRAAEHTAADAHRRHRQHAHTPADDLHHPQLDSVSHRLASPERTSRAGGSRPRSQALNSSAGSIVMRIGSAAHQACSPIRTASFSVVTTALARASCATLLI